MKKYVKLLFLIVLVFTFTGCNKETMYTDYEVKFKNEYESLNGKANEKGEEYKNVSIDDDNNVTYIDENKVIDILENGTGVIYFGFPECPWCRNAVPVLISAADEVGMDIYYFNALSIRDVKELDEYGDIITTKEGTKEYYKIIELLGDNADTYSGLDDESEKRLYFPTVVFVRDGEILGLHSGTVDSQEDPYVDLDENQTEELLNIYINYMHEVLNNYCDEKC